MLSESCTCFIVSYRGQDGAQGFDAHSDVQQMTGVEKGCSDQAVTWPYTKPAGTSKSKTELNEWSLL